MTKRQVTEQDFRMPEFVGKDPIDYEFRKDGVIVRKDRWEVGFRAIVGAIGMSRDNFEIDEVVENIREMHKAVNQGFAMHKALTDIVDEFEKNRVVDGVIVGKLDPLVASMYGNAKRGLKEVTEE